jgi:hypothetical protein
VGSRWQYVCIVAQVSCASGITLKHVSGNLELIIGSSTRAWCVSVSIEA